MSHIHKSTKMRFPGNRPKMPKLLKNIISSKIVLRGWFMTLFDRRDLLNSEKNVWGGFPNFPDLSGPICDFSRISRWTTDPRKTEFLDFRVRKKCSKIDFFKMFWIFQKIWNLSSFLVHLHRASLQFSYFTSSLKL